MCAGPSATARRSSAPGEPAKPLRTPLVARRGPAPVAVGHAHHRARAARARRAGRGASRRGPSPRGRARRASSPGSVERPLQGGQRDGEDHVAGVELAATAARDLDAPAAPAPSPSRSAIASASRWLPPAIRWLGSGSNAAACSSTSAPSRSRAERGGDLDAREHRLGRPPATDRARRPPPPRSAAPLARAARATARPAACSSSAVARRRRAARARSSSCRCRRARGRSGRRARAGPRSRRARTRRRARSPAPPARSDHTRPPTRSRASSTQDVDAAVRELGRGGEAGEPGADDDDLGHAARTIARRQARQLAA